MNKWKNEWVNEWINEQMNGWMNTRMNHVIYLIVIEHRMLQREGNNGEHDKKLLHI